MSAPGGKTVDKAPSFAAPFRRPAFAVIWTATLISNVGWWMYSAASGWLMTSLNPDPLIVALVQAASSLPIFLFAIPAGALADIFDKRKFLVIVESLTTAVSAVYAVMVGFGLATPGNLLLFTFLIGAAGALTVPAWQAVVPQLVPKKDLPAAIAANSAGVNVSRALGPALGGVTISAYGIVAPFWANAIANLAIVGSLLWWRPRRGTGRCCRPSASAKPSWPAFVTPGITSSARHDRAGRRIFLVHKRLLGAAAAGQPRADREGARGFTACCSASSAPAPWPGYFFCRG